MITHLRREIMQAIWTLLLDDEFMDAYINGIVLEFSDGIMRRWYPRFFTYSADALTASLPTGTQTKPNNPGMPALPKSRPTDNEMCDRVSTPTRRGACR